MLYLWNNLSYYSLNVTPNNLLSGLLRHFNVNSKLIVFQRNNTLHDTKLVPIYALWLLIRKWLKPDININVNCLLHFYQIFTRTWCLKYFPKIQFMIVQCYVEEYLMDNYIIYYYYNYCYIMTFIYPSLECVNKFLKAFYNPDFSNRPTSYALFSDPRGPRTGSYTSALNDQLSII